MKHSTSPAGMVLADPERVLKQVLAKLEEDCGVGGYFFLVPSAHKLAVRALAETNHKFFRKQFRDFNAFLNEMAKNWLAKWRAFGALASASGFVPATELRRTDLNESCFAMLSQNGSYIIVGQGAFDREKDGASLLYAKIPFRPDAPADEAIRAGAFLKNAPIIGESANIEGRFSTSPLISVFVKRFRPEEDELASMKELQSSVSSTFHGIDEQSLRSLGVKK